MTRCILYLILPLDASPACGETSQEAMSDANVPFSLGQLLCTGGKPVVRLMDFLRGEQVLLALVSKAMLAQVKVGQNITEWGKIPLQRRSAILRLAGTTGQAGDTRA